MKAPHFIRFILISVVFGIVGVAIISQMARIQNSEDADLFRAQSEQYKGTETLVYPERGDIYDRYGNLLAGNETIYEVGWDLSLVENPNIDGPAVAQVLTKVMDKDYQTVLDLAQTPYKEGTSVYVILADFATADQVEEIKRMQKQYQELAVNSSGKQVTPSLDALTFNAHLRRSYPEHSLASNILGFYSYQDRTSGRGYFGVEEKYNDLLAGTPVNVYIPNDPIQAQDLPEVPPGSDLVLTIDRDIQKSIETILDNAIKDTDASGGTIIVMDPETGEILGIANDKRIDLNNYWSYTEEFTELTYFNRAVGVLYEPGSVFKVLTMAAALDKGVVTPSTPFLDTGTYEIGGIYINNWDGGAWGPQDMVGCMQHSLNVCLAWVASELGPTDFYKYIQAFGIGHTTGIDLAGEVSTSIRLPGDGQWLEMDLGTNSFGQGIAVTPIQMVMAASALANDGKMMTPHVLKALVDNDHQYETTPQVAGTPIQAQTAKTITEMLAKSLEEESSDAEVDGYRVAGKTGTAQIPTEKGYTLTETNASFVGWGPADDPKFLVYVWLEKPRTSIWGSVVAAPVFRDVVKSLVVLMDIPPDSIRNQLANSNSQQ